MNLGGSAVHRMWLSVGARLIAVMRPDKTNAAPRGGVCLMFLELSELGFDLRQDGVELIIGRKVDLDHPAPIFVVEFHLGPEGAL